MLILCCPILCRIVKFANLTGKLFTVFSLEFTVESIRNDHFIIKILRQPADKGAIWQES